MAKYFINPFAGSGDKTEVPDGSQANQTVSYETGYTENYEFDLDINPAALDIERAKLNQVLNDITSNLKEWQEGVFPAFITASENGGLPYTYSEGDIVQYQGANRISLVDNNTDLPSNETPYYLDGASYDSLSLDTSTQDSMPVNTAFNSDGTKAYILGFNTDAVYQYNLSTAWDISSATYDSVSFSVSSEVASSNDLTIRDDGVKMYVLSTTDRNIYQYTLSTPFDLSTASYDGVSFNFFTEDGAPRGVYFKPDGLKLYMVGSIGADIYQYSLSSAWDVSTLSYDSVSFSPSVGESEPRSVSFNADGSKMFMLGLNTNTVFQFSLSTEWDISTLSYDSINFSTGSEEGSPVGMVFGSDGSKMYISGVTSGDVFQYSTVNVTSSWADLFPLPEQFGGTGVQTLTELLTALDVYTKTESDSRYLQVSNNLSDVADPAAARINLGITDAADIGTGPDQISTNELGDARWLRRDNNLSDVDDPETARANLGIPAPIDIGTGPTQVSDNTLGDARWLNQDLNLNDLPSKPTARTNLGLGSVATEDSSSFTNGLLPLADLSAWQSALGITGGGGGGDGLETGMVIASLLDDATMLTAGFLPMNGAEVSRTTYADLFAAIPDYIGDGDGFTTFNLPVGPQFNIQVPGVGTAIPLASLDISAFNNIDLAVDQTNQTVFVHSGFSSSFRFEAVDLSDNSVTTATPPTSTTNISGLAINQSNQDKWMIGSVTGTGRSIWKDAGGTGSWTFETLISGVERSISVNDSTGDVWHVTSSGLYKWDGSTITQPLSYPGSSPLFVDVNPSTGDLFVVDGSDDDVYFYPGGVAPATVIPIPQTSQYGAALNRITGDYYVLGSTNLYVLLNGTSSLVDTGADISAFAPRGLGFDSLTGNLYIQNITGNELMELPTLGETQSVNYYIKF